MSGSVTPTKKRSKLPWIFGVVIVLAGAGAYALSLSVNSAMATTLQPTYTVREGPLVISVVEPGTIKSLEQVSLKCEVEGAATIIFLIPEGTEVQTGDLLVELDASKLQDELIAQQISVDNAEASFIRARESLAVAKNQAESDISKAELDYQFAQEDVTQYTDGTHPQEVKEAQTNITLAHEELQRAAETLTWSEKLFAKKYISQTELEADRLTKKRAELNHELAVASLDLLEDYTSPRKLAELKSNVDQMKMALERVKLQSNADVVQAEADLKAKKRELDQQNTKLDKLEHQIEKTKIYAPRGGLVVYATSVQTGGRRMRNEPLEEGQSVRERQELIYLPSAESMMAEVLIHESSLEKVRVGLPVRLTIDALPGVRFAGRVAKIAPLPDAQSAWLNPDLKVYPCEIHLDGTHPELRTGMSCQAEVIVEQFPNALYVPVQAVLRIGNVPNVFVRNGERFQATPIDIGLDNNSMVRVISGLEPGQEVLLTPPLEAGATKHEPQLAEMSIPARQETGAAPGAGVQPMSGGQGGPRGAGNAGEGASPGGPPGANFGGPNGAGGFGPGGAGQGPPQMGGGGDGDERRQRFMNMSEEERIALIRQRHPDWTDDQIKETLQRMQQGGIRPGGGRGEAGPGGQGGNDRQDRSQGGPGGERSGGERPRGERGQRGGDQGNRGGNGGGE